MHAQRPSGLTVGEAPALEVRVEARRQVLRPLANPPLLRQPGEGEDRVIARRDDVGGIARAPDLDERWILPDVGGCVFNAGMERVERRAWSAVLQAAPRGKPERIGTRRKSLVECLDTASKGKDLRPRGFEPARHPQIDAARGFKLTEADSSRALRSLARGADGEQQLRPSQDSLAGHAGSGPRPCAAR